jgi:hypothetical protein
MARSVFTIAWVLLGLSLCAQDNAARTTQDKAAFVNTPVVPFEQGRRLAAGIILVSDGTVQSWSLMKDCVIGERTVKYPVVGMVKFPDSGSTKGSVITVVVSRTVISEDIPLGAVLHSGGYLMEAKRAIKAGDIIPTLLIKGDTGDSIMSMEAAPNAVEKGDSGKPQPWLTIFDERPKDTERALALDGWRISNERVNNQH